MEFVVSNGTGSTSGSQEYQVSFDNRYMLTGFVNASLMPGTPFVNMWGNVTVSSLLATDKYGVTSRIDRRFQSLNQDNIAIAYDQNTLDSISSLLRICRWPSIEYYKAFLSDANVLYPCTIENIETSQYISQPIDIDIDHTIFTTQYATWNAHRLRYSGLSLPQNGDVWSGGLVLGSSDSIINLAEYLTRDIAFNTGDVQTYIEKLVISMPVPGYQYLRAQGYATPFVRADMPYTLEWLSDNPNVIGTELYCRDLCCAGCNGVFYGTFAPSGEYEVDGHPHGTQRIWMVKGIDSYGSVVSQMWFTAVSTCPRKLTYFDEFLEDCKIWPSQWPPPPTPPPLPRPLSPSPSSSLEPSPSPSPTPSLSYSPMTSLSPSLSLSVSLSPSGSLSLSPSPSLSKSISPSPSPSPSLERPSLSPSLERPSLSPSVEPPSLSPSAEPPMPAIGNYWIPRIADAMDGRFAITWAAYDVDGYTSMVMAQCFDAGGNNTTAPFIVASIANKTSYTPDITMADDGAFIIVWKGPDANYSDGIQARCYNADGTPNTSINGGNQFRVDSLSPYTAGTFSAPAVSMSKTTKSFIVAWSHYSTSLYSTNIFCQRFNASAVKVPTITEPATSPADFASYSTTLVNTTAQYYAGVFTPDVAMADDGKFIIVWHDQNHYDSGRTTVYAQRYTAAGERIGSQFRINQTSTLVDMAGNGTLGTNPRIAIMPDGSFVVVWWVWSGAGFVDSNGSNPPVSFMTRFNSSGTRISELNLHDDFTPYHYHYRSLPDVAFDRDGNIVVVYQAYNESDDPLDEIYGTGTHSIGIFAKQFDSTGALVANNYCVNNPNLAARGIGDQKMPAVARSSGSGRYVTAWAGPQGIVDGLNGIWYALTAGMPLPDLAWSFLAPLSGTFVSGAPVTIQWSAVGVQPDSTVNVCLATNLSNFSGAIWLSIGVMIARNGITSWSWNGKDSGGNAIPAGTYYIAGYIYDGDTSIVAHSTSSFTII